MESGPKDKDDDDIFHFVAYVPVQGIVYELDGLKEGPFVIGPVADDTNPLSWLDVVRPALEERIARYASNEIRFNLMAIVPNKTHQLQRLRARYLQEGNDSMIAEVDRSLQDEQARRAEWAKENQRRRWNYVPFLMTMLRILSEKGELTPMIRQALASSNQQQTSSNNKPTME
jgi:ubiquitin carboxyl-terminal hydrolase L5